MKLQTVVESMELQAESICLRPWNADHVQALQEAAVTSASSVGRWLPWCRADYSLDDAIAWVDFCRGGWLAGEHFSFGIFESSGDALLGGVGLSKIDAIHRTANLGYWIRSSQQRKGIAVRASKRLATFGFSILSLARIEIVVMPENIASNKTALGLGANLEGIARQRLWIEDSGHDALIYGLIPTDAAAHADSIR